MSRRRKPAMFIRVCRYCGFRGTRGVRVCTPRNESEPWNVGVCKHKGACQRRGGVRS